MRRKKKRGWIKLLGNLYLAIVLIFAVSPLLWGLITSLKLSKDIITFPPKWLPIPMTFEHYAAVLTGSKLLLYLWNNLIVAVGTIILSLVIGVHGAYATSRFNFKFKNIIVFGILATSMVPGISILVPLYLSSVKMNLHDTFISLILVYSAWQMPTVLWILRGFIDRIPRELEEAAYIDGCSRLGAFYRITMPALRPGLGAAAILVFVFVWNDWLISSVLTISDSKRLLQVGLYRYVGDYGVEWGRFMAYVMISTIPIIAAFLALQRAFIQGLTSGSVKG